MISRKFKSLETINRFKMLYEADEQQQNDEQAPVNKEGDEQQMDATEPPAEDGNETNDLEGQASPELGTFMSDNQKAELAKMLLDALMLTPPEPGTIPSELMNVSTSNADQVIKYIQGLNALSGPLSLDNDSDSNSMAGALKEI
jgi:hypothetical protein